MRGNILGRGKNGLDILLMTTPLIKRDHVTSPTPPTPKNVSTHYSITDLA